MNVKDELKKFGKKALDTFDSLSKADPEVLKLVNERIGKQDRWNDVFSTKLIELLDKNDAIRAEIRKRLLQIEEASRAREALLAAATDYQKVSAQYQGLLLAVTQAKDRFERAEALQVDAAQLRQAAQECRTAESQFQEAKASELQARDSFAQAKELWANLHRDAAESLEQAKDLAHQVERLATDAQERLGAAQKSWEESKQALEASSANVAEARRALQSAESAATVATQRSASAETCYTTAQTLFERARDAADSARTEHSRAQEALSEARTRSVEAEERANRAEACQRQAEERLDRSTLTLRNAHRFALAGAVCAFSAALWGMVVISEGSTWAYVPAALTVTGIVMAVLAWRRVE